MRNTTIPLNFHAAYHDQLIQELMQKTNKITCKKLNTTAKFTNKPLDQKEKTTIPDASFSQSQKFLATYPVKTFQLINRYQPIRHKISKRPFVRVKKKNYCINSTSADNNLFQLAPNYGLSGFHSFDDELELQLIPTKTLSQSFLIHHMQLILGNINKSIH